MLLVQNYVWHGKTTWGNKPFSNTDWGLNLISKLYVYFCYVHVASVYDYLEMAKS